MVRFAAYLVVLAGCYSPAYRDCEVTCESGNGCPSGLSCESGMCRVSGHGSACGSSGDDGDIDGRGGGDAGDAGATVGVGAVAALSDHTCAICGRDGSLWCWGSNQSGESSGSPVVAGCNATSGCNPTPTQVAFAGPVTAVGLGPTHSCATYVAGTTNGQLACWGANASGQFGNGTTLGSVTPVDIVGRYASAISGGTGYNCFIMDGQVFCAGKNTSGQLGDSDTQSHVTPDKTANLVAVNVLAAGDQHACAIMNGAAYCWGNNGSSETTGTGQPVPSTVLSPHEETLGDPAVEIDVGDQFSCAVTQTHDLKCWGSNQLGQFGDGTPGGPVAAKTVQTGIAHVAAGGAQTCTIGVTGSVSCSGQLTGVQVTSPLAIAIPSGRSAVAITAGGRHACAILDDRSLVCWGNNTLGQLGTGTHDTGTMTPQQVHVCE